MLVDKISSSEKEIINILRKEYASDSDFIIGNFVDCDNYLSYWEEAKTQWAQVFHDTLIYKKNIDVTIEDDELYAQLNNLARNTNFSRLKVSIVDSLSKNNDDDFCIDDKGKDFFGDPCIYKRTITQVLNQYIFYPELWIKNIYEGPTFEIKVNENGDTYKFSTGCKIMKILGRLARLVTYPNLYEYYENFRIAHSKIMNEAHINATLCISIHPLDYMTASYNDNDWRSCMCWVDGEYRRGVVEMMNSPYVVVAYLESKNKELSFYSNYSSPKLTWNSKRWREFFIVSPEMISGIKGYPYWNRDLEDKALNMIKDLFSSTYPWLNSCNTINHYKARENTLLENDNRLITIDNDCGPAMYNDFYGNNEYHAFISPSASEKIDIFYSGASECVCCGKTSSRVDFECEGNLICNSCVESYYCDKCGDLITNTDDLIEYEGRIYCRCCYDDLPRCDYCNKIVDEDWDNNFGLFAIGTGKENIIINSDDSEFYRAIPVEVCCCNECADEVFTLKHNEFNQVHDLYGEWWRKIPIVPIDRMTKKGLSIIEPECLKSFLNKTQIVLNNNRSFNDSKKIFF